MWDRLVDEWNEIAPEVCQNLIESMPMCIEAVIKANGGSYQVLGSKIIHAHKTVPMSLKFSQYGFAHYSISFASNYMTQNVLES